MTATRERTRQKTARSLASLSDERLLQLRVELEQEMRRRKIRFSVGDLAERLVIAHYKATPGLPKLQLAPPGTKNVDALSRHGERFSIKGVLDAKKTGTIYPDPADEDKQLFEHLIVAQLSEQFALRAVYQFTWDQFKTVRCWDKRMSAWYVPFTAKALTYAIRVV